MHSEFEQETKNSYMEAQKHKQAQSDAKVQGQADAAQSFMKHPHWIIFCDDMKKEREHIVNLLINDTSLSKERMNKIRNDIQMIDKVTKQPMEYIKRLRGFYARKKIK